MVRAIFLCGIVFFVCLRGGDESWTCWSFLAAPRLLSVWLFLFSFHFGFIGFSLLLVFGCVL